MSITNSTSTVIRRDSQVSFLQSLSSNIQSSPLTQFVSDFTTNKMSLVSGWAGAAPSPRRRDGQVVHRRLKFYEHTVTPVIWDNTLDVDISTLNDAQATGVAIDAASKLGIKNARHQLSRAVAVLEAGTGTTIATGYDGVALFSGSHPESGTNQDNDFTSAAATGTAPTASELESAIDADCVAMMGFTDDQGDIYDLDSGNFTFVFPRQMWTVAHKVLGNNGTVGTSGSTSAMGTQTTNADDTLPTGVFRGTYNYYFDPLLSNADRFYILRSARAGNVGPLVFNMREPWKLITKTPDNSDYSVDNDVIWHTAKARYDVGYGDWRAAGIHIFT